MSQLLEEDVTMVESMGGESQDTIAENISQETPPSHAFIAPSIDRAQIHKGASYTYHSGIPSTLQGEDNETECVLGVDEAGRGPVLGPMVYGIFYCSKANEQKLLKETYHFDDSKVLTPEVRHDLMTKLCTPGSDLFDNCGFATRVISPRDISAGMMRPTSMYNLNAQAMDCTIQLLKEVFDKGVNIKEVYVDTIGSPMTYQRKLEKIFPTVRITVAKKADSLYPCVSAASVCAKVTRDAALEVCSETYADMQPPADNAPASATWGSGYPSDARCTTWMKRNMDPIFGWGSECRFSWGTAKEMLEAKNAQVKVTWPDADSEDGANVSQYFVTGGHQGGGTNDDQMLGIATWFGKSVSEEVF